MASGNTIRLGVQLDDGGVTKKLNGISGAFDKLGGKGSGASLFGNVGAKAVASGFNLISDAIGGTVGFLQDAVKAATEDAASEAKLNQALLNNVTGHQELSQAIRDYVDEQGKRGFADDEVRDGLGQLVGITHDVTKAQDLLTIAEDLARAKGIDLAQATDIVTKAAQGNGKALKSLGIDTKGATDATALLGAITDNTKGSADAYNQTLEGKLNKSQIAYNEAVEDIGKQLMPVLADIMQKFADDWLPALGRGWDKVLKAIKPVADIIRSVIGLLGDAIAKIQDFLHWIDEVAKANNAGNATFRPKIPGHAAGGWVGLNGPELAVVGERGPEYIVPNRSSRSGYGALYADSPGHGHAIIMDGKKVADAVSSRQWYDQRRAAITNSKV